MTKTYQTTPIQDELAAKLAATEYAPGHTFAGKWWGRGATAERFYFGESACMTKDGKKIRNKVWLQFDDPATLDGCSLRVEAKKHWYGEVLAEMHAAATLVAIGLVDPEAAAKLRAEIDRTKGPIGDMVAGEDD